MKSPICCYECWPMETLVDTGAKGKPERLDKTRQFVRVAIRDGGRCFYCDLDLDRYDSYNVLDHVIPKGKGGRLGLMETVLLGDDNVVIACRDCRATSPSTRRPLNL